MTPRDDQLVTRCAAGDERAWRRLVDDYGGYVLAIARAHRLPEDACEDVAQNVFAALAASIATLADDRVIAAWLRTTATRECWRTARRLARTRAAEMSDDQASPAIADRLERVESHQRLRSALQALGQRCRDLLRILYGGSDGDAYQRVAAEMDMPVGSIGPTRRRCLDRLARLIRGDDEDE